MSSMSHDQHKAALERGNASNRMVVSDVRMLIEGNETFKDLQ